MVSEVLPMFWDILNELKQDFFYEKYIDIIYDETNANDLH